MNNDLKYLQLQEAIKAELKSGGYKPGDKFYTNKELMSKYQCSYATVSHALKEMVAEGYFTRHRSLGTFVKESSHIPGMTGNIMTKTLFINNTPTEEHCQKREKLSWFVIENIRNGIINNYPGSVKIEPMESIKKRLDSNEDILTILYAPPKEFIKENPNLWENCIVINHARIYRMKNNSVSWEMLSGVYEGVSYLIRELGHSKIAFIGGDRPLFHADRFAGYKFALSAYDIPLREEWIVKGFHGEIKDGHKGMSKILSAPELPTAVFVDTDLKALGAIEAITEAGLKVPDDISVIGFDDMPGADQFDPPLTTVRIPYYDIGKTAVEMLLEKLKTGSDIKTKILRSELIIRESCIDA